MALLEAKNLSVSFDTSDGIVKAVKNIDFAIAPGECLGIVGESGSGKSQTFLAAMGLLPKNGHASGSVTLNGTEILNLPINKLNSIRGSSMAMIFQDPLTALTPHLKVGEQMQESLGIHQGLSGRKARKHCLDWLDKVRMPEAERRLEQYPHELSGGMRQRVMIAMAMLNNPKLLIADEPTTALDVTVQAEILDLIADLQKNEGTAVALITHDMGVVARMCDRIEVMRYGAYVESGSADDIFYAPKHEYTQRLLSAMPRLDTVQEDRVKIDAEKLLTVNDVKVHFPIAMSKGLFPKKVPLKAVDGVSFDIMAGETLGVVGESGCGKSTLARAVLQLIPPSSGAVSWLGHDLASMPKSELKQYRKDLQIVFQDPLASLDPRMTIADSIAEPLKTFRPDMTVRERKRKVEEMMERVGLEQSMINRYPHELSGGQNQRVGVARAMINKPRLIICDEAVSALDVSIQAQIVALLKELQDEFGMSMIFISHDLSVVRDVSDRIMVLYLGRVVELAHADAIYKDARHPYTKSLISAVPIPDPKIEKSRSRLKIPGELPSPLNPRAALRFLPSKLRAGEMTYIPKLQETTPGHWVAEHDPLDVILAGDPLADQALVS
ncbi:MAG: ABC transporter ATP-binding protein [Paracoccaceae bacterium]|jgi:peptide/nickel transport system ATP-binding protein|nr:ABC transporter ATP-binding protein [Paracoccaceae bacterium]